MRWYDTVLIATGGFAAAWAIVALLVGLPLLFVAMSIVAGIGISAGQP